MKSGKIISISFILIVFGITGALAQEVNILTAVEGSGNSGNSGNTIQKDVYTAAVALNVPVVKSGEEPYQISVITNSDNVENNLPEFNLSADSETEYLVLKSSGDSEKTYIASLYNINGNQLQTQKIKAANTTFSMQSYISETYFISVADEKTQRVIKSFQVVKQ